MTLSEYIDELRCKKVDVIGIGVSNRPLIRLLRSNGIEVTARDKTPRERLDCADELEAMGVSLVLGSDYLANLEGDVIFRSPGIRPDVPEFCEAVRRGAVLTSEMEAFFEVCPCPITAVTGSDGKTTTTTVISEILKNAGKKVWIGGNIGTPLLDRAGEMKLDDYCVLELSSFQLMTIKKSPTVAVITNLSPNHLDWHRNMEEYLAAKINIFNNDPQPEKVVLNLDNDATRALISMVKSECLAFSRMSVPQNGFFCRDDVIYSKRGDCCEEIMSVGDIFIPGVHNVENYMAAFAATDGIASRAAMIKTAKEFRGVEHRIEFVRELNGIKLYNDSIASSPSRTTAGLRSFKQKVILIAGGKDKGVPFDSLGPEIVKHVKKLVVTGLTADKIRDAAINAGFMGEIISETDFDEAVKKAYGAAEKGDIVILSPACTSFDRFKNFAERGRHFKDIVMGLE